MIDHLLDQSTVRLQSWIISREKSNNFLEFDFDEDDTTLGIDLGKDKILMEPNKRKEKKEPEKVFSFILKHSFIHF